MSKSVCRSLERQRRHSSAQGNVTWFDWKKDPVGEENGRLLQEMCGKNRWKEKLPMLRSILTALLAAKSRRLGIACGEVFLWRVDKRCPNTLRFGFLFAA
jgi:hypothetical protein